MIVIKLDLFPSKPFKPIISPMTASTAMASVHISGLRIGDDIHLMIIFMAKFRKTKC
jgi:hypothetical protein